MLEQPRQVLRLVAGDGREIMRNLKPFARSRRRTKGTFVALVVLASSMLCTTGAHADVSAEDKQKARAAYIRATEANERGDYAVAARELALADELAPNAVTLQAAIEATLDADTPELGMELVLRAEIRGDTGEIATVAATARKRFAGRTGRVTIVCPDLSCQATLDGTAVPVAKERFVRVGKHTAIVSRNGATTQREIDVQAGGLTTVNGPDEQPTTPPRTGLSVGWFGAGVAATLVAGVWTIVSGASTKDTHDMFVASRCAEPGAGPRCTNLANAGQSSQTRTNVLAGVTAAFGLTTAVLGGITFSKKNTASKPSSSLSIEPRKDGAFARLVIVLP